MTRKKEILDKKLPKKDNLFKNMVKENNSSGKFWKIGFLSLGGLLLVSG